MMSGADNIPCEKCGYGKHGLYDIKPDGRWQLICFRCNHVQSETYDPDKIDSW